MTWESCRIGSCHRHQKCMYTPCRSSPDAQARLKACPFCGEPPFAQSSFMDADLKQACYIACRTCDVSPEGCYRKAKEWPQAIAAWNTRTPDAQPEGEVERRMIELYLVDRVRVAKLCDEQLDRSGNLLGYLRSAAIAVQVTKP